jgi:hypothetical protein
MMPSSESSLLLFFLVMCYSMCVNNKHITKLFSENNVKLIEFCILMKHSRIEQYCWYKRQQNRILVPVNTTIYYFILNFSILMSTHFGHSTIFRSTLENLAYMENSQNLYLTCALICDSTYTHILETYIIQPN